MEHNRTEELMGEALKLGSAGSRLTAIFGVLGLAGLVVSGFLASGSEEAAADFYHAYLVNFTYVMSLALGGLFFVLVTHLVRAGWSIALRRLAEVSAVAVVPLGLLGVVVLFGLHHLYEWSHVEAVAGDALLQEKSAFLNERFFIIRYVVYFVLWAALSIYFLRKSVAQDDNGDPKLTLQMERFAAPGMIVFALTVTFFSFDLLMSLYPHWYSTIYGVYYFAGCVLGFLSLLPVLVGLIKRAGKLTRVIGTDHLHDVGKLMFAFVVFWAYIAFSQYMLIWYGNIPEETVFYKIRQTGPWLNLSLVLLFGHFLLPFLALMSRHPKRRAAALTLGAIWLLAMHWFDLFYLVMPGAREGAPFRLVDLTCLVGLLGLFLAVVFRQLTRVRLVPQRDPRLAESLRLENV